MRKSVVVELLFNEKKYGLEKFLLLLLLWFVISYVGALFQVSLILLYVPVLMLMLITGLIKIMWYNKKEKKNTRVSDWIGIVLAFIVLGASVFHYWQDSRVEEAVYDAIGEKVGDESFTINYFEEIEREENTYLVHYTVEGENTEYLEWYDWRNGELIHKNTKTLGDMG
ncbi:hypothetical protein [Pontibacillus salipaludis]|uniref:DUF4178 domain-containing protein n=1 Tax=Pontibacillus salipaludis TaxID=1697394 RepID=A0ABQ1Q6C0_9BACI|nr:hypothetical protein [Pontibacillus salipaludis]GGD14100.1 hypothetical protein GCM10011389_22190 [Pontibacillus salipaludis]